MTGDAPTPTRLHVALVGDNEQQKRLLRLAFLSAGVRIVADTDLLAAPVAAARDDVDVCVVARGSTADIDRQTRALTASADCPPVVVVVQVARLPELIEVLAAGAYGYLLDSMPPEQMGRALAHAADRRTALPRSVIESAAEQLRRDADPGLAGVSTTFTPRERQTLTMLRGGSSTRAIADHLGVTPATVRTYVSAVVRKLGARDRSELVLPLQAEAEQPAPLRFLHGESGHRADVPSPRNVQRRVSPSS